MRLAAHLPRLLLLGAVFLFAGATLTYGAATRLSADTAAKPAGPAPTPTVTVPDVAGQAFGYAETGEPEDLSPYVGTAIVPANAPPVTAAPSVKPAVTTPVTTKPATKKSAAPKKPAVKK